MSQSCSVSPRPPLRFPWLDWISRPPFSDQVVRFIFLLLVAIAVFAPHRVTEVLRFTWENLAHIAPFLLLSSVLAAFLAAAKADRTIGRVFRGRAAAGISGAALVGAVSPFCSCGVIPVIAALLASGVPLPGVVAFWVASPLMSPDMFAITGGELGWGFAVAKLVSAVAIGLASGWATHLLEKRGFFANPLRNLKKFCGAPAVGGNEGIQWKIWKEQESRTAFTRNTLQMLGFLGKWLTVAYVLESLMIAYLPPETLGSLLGFKGSWGVPIAAIIGVPAYLNGYAAIPLTAGLMKAGMSPGAALAFMTAGAMTSIPAMVAVYTLVRRNVFMWYLFLALTCSILAGYGYDAFLEMA